MWWKVWYHPRSEGKEKATQMIEEKKMQVAKEAKDMTRKREQLPELRQTRNHLPEQMFCLIPFVSSECIRPASRRNNSLCNISKLVQSAVVTKAWQKTARERKHEYSLANYALKRTGKTNKQKVSEPAGVNTNPKDWSACFLNVGMQCGEHRKREWSLQWLLAGGQYMAQWSPQMYMWRQSHGVPAFGTNSNFLSAVKLVMAATWEEPITLLPMVAAYSVRYCIPLVPHLRDSKSQPVQPQTIWAEVNLCALSLSYGPISRVGNTLTYFILSVRSLEHNSAHCIVQEKHKHIRKT